MKIIFGSILLSGVIQKIIVLTKKEPINNICFSNFIAALTAIPIYLIMYLPLFYIIGESMFLAISIMLITIVISQVISYKIINKDNLKLEKLTIIFTIIIYLIFTILTYNPIKSDLFIDPKNGKYGINKKND